MKNILTVIVISLVIIFVGLGVVMFYIFTPSKDVGSEHDAVQPGIVYNTGDIFVTNLKDMKKILRADIIIEVEDKNAESVLKENNHKIRDKIIYILGNVSEDDIEQQDFKDSLKERIKKGLQTALKIDEIRGVYFNEFVVQ